MLEKLKTTTDIAKLGPSTNYGLFVPSESGSKSGVWLDLESTIEKYATEGLIKSGVRKYYNIYHITIYNNYNINIYNIIF